MKKFLFIFLITFMFITNVKAEDLKLTENALKMDGSQIYLKAGEKMTVNDLIKAYV